MNRTLLALSALLIIGAVTGAQAQELANPRFADPGAGGKIAPPPMLRSVAEAKGVDLEGLDRMARAKACEVMTMTCGSTVNSVLDVTDCDLDDGTKIDFWEFPGTAGQTVTIDMTSSEFDTFLFLLDPAPDVVAVDDDGGSGTNSRLVHTLGDSGNWTIGANGFAPSDLGAYTLSLSCSGTMPTAPAAPSNLTATALSSSEINLAWQDNSNNEDEFRIEIRTPATGFEDIGAVPANTTTVDVISLDPETTYTFRVRARNSAGNSGYSNQAEAMTPGESDCVPTLNNLCLSGGRFKVEVDWRDFDNNVGVGTVVPFGSDDSGLFWFFAPQNWEMLVKVLDTCGSPFDSFWVFSAATTNVEYTLKVTDTQTGDVKEYFNPLGNAAPAITDTSAFETCP